MRLFFLASDLLAYNQSLSPADRSRLLRVEVRFYGFVRDVIANSALSLELPAGSTLRDLLTESIRQTGERLRDRLFTSSGDLEANVQVFVGAEQSASLEEIVPNGRENSEVKIFVLSAQSGG